MIQDHLEAIIILYNKISLATMDGWVWLHSIVSRFPNLQTELKTHPQQLLYTAASHLVRICCFLYFFFFLYAQESGMDFLGKDGT